MTAYNRIFLDNDNFYNLNDTYTNVNGIWLLPMEFAVIHNGTTLGFQTVSLSGVVLEEAEFADFLPQAVLPFLPILFPFFL